MVISTTGMTDLIRFTPLHTGIVIAPGPLLVLYGGIRGIMIHGHITGGAIAQSTGCTDPDTIIIRLIITIPITHTGADIIPRGRFSGDLSTGVTGCMRGEDDTTKHLWLQAEVVRVSGSQPVDPGRLPEPHPAGSGQAIKQRDLHPPLWGAVIRQPEKIKAAVPHG